MMTKTVFGSPIATDAVIVPVEEAALPDCLAAARRENALYFSLALTAEDLVYGLGETTGGINKRGKRFISYNSDNPFHRPDTVSLYGAHNFVIVDGAQCRGFFFDTPARVIFDVDVKHCGLLEVTCQGQDMTVYSLTGDSAYDVARQFLKAIGQSYLPPLWAFGFGQSRWGYKNQADIRRVVSGYHRAGIPLDYVCMDIDYMDRYIDFTIDETKFPQFPEFVQELKQSGVRLVPIVDAGVKIEPGNPVYEEGVAKGYFCKNKDGGNFAAAVWPGLTHFTDFFQPEASRWFGQQYRFYTDQGIEGFWNDMNEPSIFYSEYTKGKIVRDEMPGGDNNYQKGVSIFDYKNFTHKIGEKTVVHDDVHNLYGYLMTRSASTQLQQLMPGRFLLFSRSSYIGAHRYGGIWTGDNASKWEHLRMAVRQMPSLNLCGFLFIGTDIGGFSGNTNRELLLRWLEFGCFSPLMRDHAAKGTRNQECYQFGDTEAFRGIVSMRYRLLPYLYSEFMKAALRQDLYYKPLGFVWPKDATARAVEDQLLVGDSIMIAPILEKGKNTRPVYLPEPMTKVLYDGQKFRFGKAAAGWQTVRAKPGQSVFFIRQDKLLPIAPAAPCTDQVDLTAVTLYGDGHSYEQYVDDGMTRDCTEANIRILVKP